MSNFTEPVHVRVLSLLGRIPADEPAPIIMDERIGYRVRPTDGLVPTLAYAVDGLNGITVDYFRTRTGADYGALMLNAGAEINPHAPIGCRIGSSASLLPSAPRSA